MGESGGREQGLVASARRYWTVVCDLNQNTPQWFRAANLSLCGAARLNGFAL